MIIHSIQVGGGVDIGDLIYHEYLKENFVVANGATLKRVDYPKLIEYINKNNLWTSNPRSELYKYGVGDGSTTFTVPNYIGRFIEGANNVGIHNAGLPNITGTIFSDDSSYAGYNTGAFYFMKDIGGNMPSDVNNAVGGQVGFNASRSSAIYGASNTVQPNSIMLIPQIRYK